MTIDLSPEAVERLIHRIENRCGFDVMADHEPCLKDSYEAADVIRALADENARLRAERKGEDVIAADTYKDPEWDGDPVNVEKTDRRRHFSVVEQFAVRWEPYKPDGQRQMKAKGRWQRQVWYGDFFRWENCDRPDVLFPADFDWRDRAN